jgi:hypothetical protein
MRLAFPFILLTTLSAACGQAISEPILSDDAGPDRSVLEGGQRHQDGATAKTTADASLCGAQPGVTILSGPCSVEGASCPQEGKCPAHAVCQNGSWQFQETCPDTGQGGQCSNVPACANPPAGCSRGMPKCLDGGNICGALECRDAPPFACGTLMCSASENCVIGMVAAPPQDGGTWYECDPPYPDCDCACILAQFGSQAEFGPCTGPATACSADAFGELTIHCHNT